MVLKVFMRILGVMVKNSNNVFSKQVIVKKEHGGREGDRFIGLTAVCPWNTSADMLRSRITIRKFERAKIV